MNNKLALLLIATLLFSPLTFAKKLERFKPYRLLAESTADYATAVTQTRELLSASELTLVGEYSPYEGAHVFAVTHDILLKAAAEGEFGGYGAVLRLAITDNGDGVQVSHVNPIYMTNLYQIPEVPELEKILETTFGKTKAFGSKKGKSRKALKNYNYMMFMPKFDDHDKLGSFDSYESAVSGINTKLASGDLALEKVFEVKIPGKDETLFGIAIKEGEGADAHIMKIIDQGDIRHTAHLPYAVLVSNKSAYALAGKFRIASSFPDLSMGTFMDISEAPDAIKNSLSELAK